MTFVAHAAQFQTGQAVRVVNAWPPGHVRTPAYARGRRGVVVRVCDAYPNPEELAFRRSGLPAQPLYRVRFSQSELWPDYAGPVGDTVDIEIFQHWLEPIEAPHD